ncbi:MAG: glycosyltransferase [Actinomycetota bacterium]
MRYGFLSTYPPTQCGLATFTAALFRALVTRGGGEGRVVRAVEQSEPRPAREVVGQLVMDDAGTIRRAGELLSDTDVAIIQHEFGIYGGQDGAEILALMDSLDVPAIVVLHTVLTAPTSHQRFVLEAVAAKADAVVTMTATARERLAAGYRVDMAKVSVIPHGAPDLPTGTDRPTPLFRTGSPTVLTWGLLGPGKGIEWGIAAMAQLTDLYPAPRYVVAGQTHPKVLRHNGEAYRDQLEERVRRLGLGANVAFEANYRDAAALTALVANADVVLLPYDSTEQVTSGVLIEAIAARRPVVATRFPHAVELLAGGAGLLVPHRDPDAIAAALRIVLTQADAVASMRRAAAIAAPQLGWAAVAERYRQLTSHIVSARLAA